MHSVNYIQQSVKSNLLNSWILYLQHFDHLVDRKRDPFVLLYLLHHLPSLITARERQTRPEFWSFIISIMTILMELFETIDLVIRGTCVRMFTGMCKSTRVSVRIRISSERDEGNWQGIHATKTIWCITNISEEGQVTRKGSCRP